MTARITSAQRNALARLAREPEGTATHLGAGSPDVRMMISLERAGLVTVERSATWPVRYTITEAGRQAIASRRG